MRMNTLITVSELENKLRDEVPPAVIDVRAPDVFTQGHLPGAMNIPGDKIASSIDEIPLDRPIIVYCNMHHPGQSSSETAAETLREAGLHARALKGGFPEWRDNGNPVETGVISEHDSFIHNRRSQGKKQ